MAAPHLYRAQRRAGGLVTQFHKPGRRDRLWIAHVEDALVRVLPQNGLHHPAQVLHIEELQLHLPGTRQIKGPVLQGAIKNKGLAVQVLHWAVQVGRAQNVSAGKKAPGRPLRPNLVFPVGSPDSVGAGGLFLGKGLGIGLGVDGGGA